ncbi:MAG: hypothetical protein AAF153_01435, partial [Pseudomonadota bacterium]
IKCISTLFSITFNAHRFYPADSHHIMQMISQKQDSIIIQYCRPRHNRLRNNEVQIEQERATDSQRASQDVFYKCSASQFADSCPAQLGTPLPLNYITPSDSQPGSQGIGHSQNTAFDDHTEMLLQDAVIKGKQEALAKKRQHKQNDDIEQELNVGNGDETMPTKRKYREDWRIKLEEYRQQEGRARKR